MAYDLGDPVPLTVTIRDANKNPADAGAVTLTITHPDETTTEAFSTAGNTLQHPSTGTYQLDYYPSISGRYNVRWVATGVNASSFSDSFDVSDPTPNYIISLADAREALRFTTTDLDEDLRPFVEATTAIVEQQKGEAVVKRQVTEEYRRGQYQYGAPYGITYYPSGYPASWYGVSGVSLRTIPVISLTDVRTVDNLFTWDVTQLHVDKKTGLVTPLPGSPILFGDLQISYLAGYEIIPATIQQAARIIIQHLWSTRRGIVQATLSGRGGMSQLQQNILTILGYAVPPAAVELLGTRTPVIA